MASLECMEDQSPSPCQPRHSISNHLGIGNLCETPTTTSSLTPLYQHQQLQLTNRPKVTEKEESLSPVVPSLVHLPLCRQSPPLTGLRVSYFLHLQESLIITINYPFH